MAERLTFFDEILSGMYKTQFINLCIFADNERMMNELDPIFWDRILEAYYTADVRFRQMVWKDVNQTFAITSFPSCRLVLTRNRDRVFRGLYHSPERFDQLPAWVSGYVNFKASAFVNYLSDDQGKKFDLPGKAHEFTHAVLPDEIGLPASLLAEVWPTWINESWTVGFHQRKPDGWIANQLTSKQNLVTPSISSIGERGIFAHDQRPPGENVAYQWCAIMGEALGKALTKPLYQNDYIQRATPYMALFDITHQACRNNRTVLEEVDNIGINLAEIEQSMKRAHRLTN